jgi:integrase
MELANVVEMSKRNPKVVSRETKRRNPRGVFEKVPGSGVWWIRYSDGEGRLRRERVPSKSAGIALYRKRKTEVLQGRKLPETLRRGIVTFEEIALDAIVDIERRYRKPKYDVERLRSAITWFGSREASSMTPGMIDSHLHANATQRGWAPSTINHYRSVISLAYRLARRDRKVTTNPVRDVPHRRESNNRVRSLSADEEKSLRAVIRENFAPHEIEFDFALQTGLRLGSQFQMTWDMVDWDNRVMRIPRTKNEEALLLPLSEHALRILRRLRSENRHSSRVFMSQQNGKPLNYPKHWFVRAVRMAKIEDFHWHDLRHTFATRLRDGGAPLEDIADLLGHKGLAMTRRYAHPNMDRLRRALNGLASQRIDTPVDPVRFHDAAD